jgi:hypothetical protein
MAIHTVVYMNGRFQRAKPLIMDPGLYLDKKAVSYWVTQRRAVPNAFRLFTGMVCFQINPEISQHDYLRTLHIID